MVKLFCAIVGAAGSAFPIDIDASQSVGHLKGVIKDAIKDAIKEAKKNDLEDVDVDKLQLFLAKKDDAWLDRAGAASVALDERGHPQGFVQMDPTLWIKNPKHFGANFRPGEGQVHVLVVVPRQEQQSIALDVQGGAGKRVRVDEWFVDETFSIQKKKRKVDEDEHDGFTRYFKMARFPPLAHPMKKYTKIVERDAYAVVFAELMGKVKLCFEAESGANMVVTGNPGIGKSCFYLYCIFQFISRHQVEVKELSSFELALNFGTRFLKYHTESKEFSELNEVDVRLLQDQRRVLRLIEGKSSELTGWKGVSILFASPGLDGMNDYAKVDSFTYILPVWTLEELQEYNLLLEDGLEVAEDVLISRYDKFSGIPRFIFTPTERENDEELSKAIASFSALDIIVYAKSKLAVRDGNYSHRVLQMVPSESDLRAKFHLDFLSKYIAEKIVAEVDEDSLQKVSKFAIAHANDDSGSSSVVRGKIYEMLCHRWFNLHQQGSLQFRSLCSKARLELIIPENMETVRFSTLDEIHEVPRRLTYYQPMSRAFGALDAFILDGKNFKCYGLQMTLNLDHGIKAAPLSSFLRWLNGVGVPTDQFCFGFVVPSNLAPHYRKQTIRTKTDEIHQKPGTLVSVKQFVAALDVFMGNK